MAIRCASAMAENQGETLGDVAIRTAFLTMSGSVTDHSKAWKPPIELPMSKSTDSIPSSFRTRMEALTMSLTVILGNLK